MSTSTTSQFRPDRGNVLAAILITAICVIIVGWAPLYLFWILFFPAVAIYWLLRARTTVTERGIEILDPFRGRSSVTWDNIEGIGFKGSRTFLADTSGKQYSMPGVTFNSLPKLADASRGRIPDAITAAKEAADGKMEVVDRDGHRVLMTQEEYRAHLAAKGERPER